MNARVLEIVRYFMKENRPVAAICHAAQVLALPGCLKGRKCSCYPATSPDVTLAGGTFVDVAMTEAVVDGQPCQWASMAGARGMVAKFLTVLGTKIGAVAAPALNCCISGRAYPIFHVDFRFPPFS